MRSRPSIARGGHSTYEVARTSAATATVRPFRRHNAGLREARRRRRRCTKPAPASSAALRREARSRFARRPASTPAATRRDSRTLGPAARTTPVRASPLQAPSLLPRTERRRSSPPRRRAQTARRRRAPSGQVPSCVASVRVSASRTRCGRATAPRSSAPRGRHTRRSRQRRKTTAQTKPLRRFAGAAMQ